jgi:serine/threonine protein phosphatase PrpC
MNRSKRNRRKPSLDQNGPQGIACFGLTNPGLVRPQNEDAWFADPAQGLFLVSDGMGGQFAGAIASRIVAEVLPQMVRQRMQGWQKTSATTASENLKTILRELSVQVHQRAEGQPGLHGMGATVVLALICGTQALIAHMGDSRLYLFRRGRLKLLTKDHTIVRLLVGSGDISEKEALTHPARSQLTRFVGMEGEPLPEARSIVLEFGDLLLLCSDGLTRMVNDQKLTSLLGREKSLALTCKSLVAASNEEGGSDNITTLVVSLADSIPKNKT